MGFWITNHCRARYIERVNNGLNKDDNVNITILNKLGKAKDITNEVYDKVPRYILYLYETHGKLGQKILESEGVIFILIKREGTDGFYEVLTCYVKHKFLEQFSNTVLTREEIFLKIKEFKKKLSGKR